MSGAKTEASKPLAEVWRCACTGSGERCAFIDCETCSPWSGGPVDEVWMVQQINIARGLLALSYIDREDTRRIVCEFTTSDRPDSTYETVLFSLYDVMERSRRRAQTIEMEELFRRKKFSSSSEQFYDFGAVRALRVWGVVSSADFPEPEGKGEADETGR